MKPRQIVILGSTGSIGRSTLDVIRAHRNRFAIRGLAAHSNVPLLIEQYREFHPEYICVVDKRKAKDLAVAFAGEKVRIMTGQEDLVSLAGLQGVDLVVNAIVGAAGLQASLEAANNGIALALANKESLVAGGPLFRPLIESGSAKILPIDSEHSAVWQALASGKRDEIRSIVLTASGGPFRDLSSDQFEQITVEQALRHPTWSMGPKITIDSATMLNKGLEIIEAMTLFGVPASRIRVVVHPQSIIHSMVEFVDSSVLAQLSNPDMRLPITYALFWPDRVESEFGKINWESLGPLTFQPPDPVRFPLLRLAYKVAEAGGTAPAVYNAANEIAVAAYLKKQIKFTEIAEVVTRTVDQVDIVNTPGLEDILAADQAARETAATVLEGIWH
jgi:1-deoxy-D-xylulose-5-phosphate reductoisomerase